MLPPTTGFVLSVFVPDPSALGCVLTEETAVDDDETPSILLRVCCTLGVWLTLPLSESVLFVVVVFRGLINLVIRSLSALDTVPGFG